MQYADVQWKMTVENTSVQIDRGILRTQHFYFLRTVGHHYLMVQNPPLDKHPQSRP